MRNPALCPVKCREVTVKKKRVETFRNIRYGDGRISIIGERERAYLYSRTTGAIFLYIIYNYIYGRVLHIPYISKCFYVNFFKRNHRVQRSTS